MQSYRYNKEMKNVHNYKHVRLKTAKSCKFIVIKTRKCGGVHINNTEFTHKYWWISKWGWCNLQFYSHDTCCYSIVSLPRWESSSLALQTTYMLRLVFIRTSGTFLAHARQYWQRSTAHSTSREPNITNHPLLRWQLSSSCLPVPPTTPTSSLISPSLHCPRNDNGLAYPKSNSQPGPGMCCLHVGLLFQTMDTVWWRSDVYQDVRVMQSGRCMTDQCGQTAQQWVGNLSSLLYLTGTKSMLFIHYVIYNSSADLLI